MRLIDADALIKWLNDTYCDISKRLWNYNHHVMAMDMIEIIENYPTIEERKHGHWTVTENTYQCQFCQYWDTRKKEQVNGRYVFSKLPNYCPYCGAKMDEEESDGR